MKLISLLNRAGLNLFFFLLSGMVLLAWLFPSYGSAESPLPLKSIIDYGVSVIFFFYGLKLSWATLIAGLSHYKLHLIIQATTFILFPLFIILLWVFLPHDGYELWWIGVFYLAALPSTVSSSVVMVSIAGGNLSAAIFNASISSLIGIFITPVWMSLFINDSSFAPISGLGNIILSLCIQVLLPVVLGLLLHSRLGAFAAKYKDPLKNFDQFIILLIVYRAFSESFSGHMFDGFSLNEIVLLALMMLGLFLLMAFLMNQLSHWMKFSREDRITVVFCGSKKSLVQGAVMGQVLFTNAVAFGIILLPLMLYHALQLLAGSILAQRFARQQETRNQKLETRN
jgi:solute carrier family 10 (sodium/bile acid cotransporter), member 7